ncbi:hypothetical protein KCP76_02790 [Salmonella enterica subsp. enterica serovar Weltevreden]|nr:hypothetical protein KCP76_02790 [Salmonella enterica subsp. enterica serovar Weltevreden]
MGSTIDSFASARRVVLIVLRSRTIFSVDFRLHLPQSIGTPRLPSGLIVFPQSNTRRQHGNEPIGDIRTCCSECAAQSSVRQTADQFPRLLIQ